MPPRGPILPRKQTGLDRHKDLLKTAAFQAGTLFAIERNRRGLTQAQVARASKLNQSEVSDLENGWPLKNATDSEIDAAFKAVGLGTRSVHANFVKWWRDNGHF